MRALRLLVPFAFVACAPPASAPPASAPPVSAPAASAPPVSAPLASAPPVSAPLAPSPPHHWTYDGDEGPLRWGSLAPEFAACASGAHQSPIELSTTAAADPALALATPHPTPVPLRVVHNGHTIQVDAGASSSVTFGGTRYDLVQFHFHSPAEHTLDGARFDAEMHLVHRSAEGKLLVIGVLLKKGTENAALKPLWEAMPGAPTKAPVVIAGQTVDVAALLPKSGRYAHYEGSLTAPPCSEGVTWLVALPDGGPATELSEAQIARLRAAIGVATNRPAQPANGRAVHVVVAH
jgi:carbonic anhydrase